MCRQNGTNPEILLNHCVHRLEAEGLIGRVRLFRLHVSDILLIHVRTNLLHICLINVEDIIDIKLGIHLVFLFLAIGKAFVILPLNL